MIPYWIPELYIKVKDDPSGNKFVTVTLHNPKRDTNIDSERLDSLAG